MWLMARLTVRLLGAFQVELDEQSVGGYSSAKVRALLAFLLMERERPHSRDELCGLLWPDELQEVAQANLRQALANLRQVLGDRTAAKPFLAVSRENVGLAEDADCAVDAQEFAEHLIRCRVHGHRRPEACESCTERLHAALRLYRGDFLDSLYVDSAPEYDAWALARRERLRSDALTALSTLTERYLLTGRNELANDLAKRQLELEPWREEAHRQLMRSYALSGNRSAALNQYEICRRILAAEFQAEPSSVMQALLGQIRQGHLAGQALSRNWPVPLAAFVGRTRELAELTERLGNPTVRLITITGLGGAGKTRLAIEAGSRAAGGFADGACFVSLGGVTSALAATHAIAAALGLVIGNPAQPERVLAHDLQRRELLLVADNCEPVSEYSGLLDRLLRACPRLAVLATNRKPLGVDGEWVMRLDGLSLDVRASEGGEKGGEAAALFLERMRQAGSARPVTEADRQAVADICEHVGGLPLAIELAAAWTPVLSCAEIAAEIARGRRFLDIPRGDASGQTLGAVLDQAWHLLDSATQRVFEQAAMFRSGFRRSEASAVIQAEEATGGDAARALDRAFRLLTDRSLLHVSPNGRYRQHPVVQQFASEHLAAHPSLMSGAEHRHAVAYLRLLSAAGPDLKGERQQAALAVLMEEHANIIAAWHRGLAIRAFAMLAGAAEALSSYHDLLSRSREALDLFRNSAGIVAAGAGQDPWVARLVGELLAHAGMHSYRIHELSAAKALLERSLAALPLECDRERALALHALGNVLFWQGDVDAAEACYTEGLTLAQRAGDAWRVGSLAALLGDCASVRGSHDAAMSRYEESLVLFRELGDPHMTAVALANLGDGYRRQALLDESRAMHEESLAIAAKVGHCRLLANNYNGLGEVAYAEGDLPRAEEHFLASQEVCREIGCHSVGVLNLVGLAHVACGEGDPLRGKMFLREAVRSLIEHESWAVLPVAVTALAHILSLQRGQQETARAISLLAQVLCHPTTWEDYRHRAMRLLMELQSRLPDDIVSHAMATAEPIAPAIRDVLAVEVPTNAPAFAETGCIRW